MNKNTPSHPDVVQTVPFRRFVVGADHAGFLLKEIVVAALREQNLSVEDMGCHSLDRVDYPQIVGQVAQRMQEDPSLQGVLICGSGVGVSIAANRYPHLRAVNVPEPYIAKMCRLHNDCNVLCLGGRVIGEALALEILDVWRNTPFEGGRHADRLSQINQLPASAGLKETSSC